MFNHNFICIEEVTAYNVKELLAFQKRLILIQELLIKHRKINANEY